ncbi:MAG: glycosyltransferase, partial [Gaiellales bacterium]
IANLLALDYPPDRLDIVVASDASRDRTDEIVARIARAEPRVKLVRCVRGGKVAAQNAAVRAIESEVVAFSDANAEWDPEALRLLVRSLADPSVGYVCGQRALRRTDGTNREGAYWRYEVWLRDQEAKLGSITGGNGSIYAVRRSDYLEVDPRFGHDLAFPYMMVQRGRRAVYDGGARASEPPSRDVEDEFRRKVRMFEHCWLIVLRGGMFRGSGPLYLLELLSHRLLRYGSGVVHVVLLGTSIALIGQGLVYEIALGLQVLGLVLAGLARLRVPIPGASLSLYYLLVTWATILALVRYLRFGVPPVWEKAEGTR